MVRPGCPSTGRIDCTSEVDMNAWTFLEARRGFRPPKDAKLPTFAPALPALFV